MQSYHPIDPQSADLNSLIHQASLVSVRDPSHSEEAASGVNEPTRFYSQYIDSMEMYADVETVTRYLDVHHEWFRRCAHPMTAEPIGANSYALVIGRYGSFGYEVEPKIGLDLLPQDQGVYRIETVPVPDYTPPGYDVDFKAAMELVALPSDEIPDLEPRPNHITRIQWQLDLTVFIQFPRFIQALPKSLIQTTGDRVLHQVVRQVSSRLTRKVLLDFHNSHQIPIPKKARQHWFFRKADEPEVPEWDDGMSDDPVDQPPSA